MIQIQTNEGDRDGDNDAGIKKNTEEQISSQHRANSIGWNARYENWSSEIIHCVTQKSCTKYT